MSGNRRRLSELRSYAIFKGGRGADAAHRNRTAPRQRVGSNSALGYAT
jgi:hypothetical protein